MITVGDIVKCVTGRVWTREVYEGLIDIGEEPEPDTIRCMEDEMLKLEFSGDENVRDGIIINSNHPMLIPYYGAKVQNLGVSCGLLTLWIANDDFFPMYK